jgi:hypothetical protein
VKITVNKLAFAAMVVFLAIRCTPSNANKNAGGLRLSVPVETPDSVQFSWTGGQEGAAYSIYRRMKGDANWERIAMNLYGVSGSTFVPGFTLDQTYEYKIQAEPQ